MKKAAFSHPNIVLAKKIGAESHGCKLSETKFKALQPTEKKANIMHVVLVQKQKKNVFSIRTKNYSGKKTSSAGNRTPVSNVTG